MEDRVIHCWPAHWTEAAQTAGYAMYEGNGKWVFVNDKMRDMLEVFATELLRLDREVNKHGR